MLLATPPKSYMRDLELARVADGVNQGDETACGGQAQLHGGGGHQHDETVNGDVPDSHGAECCLRGSRQIMRPAVQRIQVDA